MANQREIYWEDYALNYNVPLSSEDAEEERDEFSEKSQNDDFGEGLQSVASDMFDSKNYVYSPWGAISKNDPFSPIKFYPDMKMMHTKYFSLHMYKGDLTFSETLDNVDGVAAWKTIDPYCFIVAKAKTYTWTEVVSNINNAFGIKQQKVSVKKNNNDEIIERLSAGENYLNTTYVIHEGVVSSSAVGDSDYEEFMQWALTLAENGADEQTVVIHQGKILCQ
jgi:hypothetical protein